jgi:S1-C subfamily serine protease
MGDKNVIATIKKVMPAVVSIAIAKHLKDVEKEMPHEMYSFLPGHHEASKKKWGFPDILVDRKGMVNVGGGSGFIVEKNGLVLTNRHVVSEARAEYTVITSDGQKYPAQVLSRDPINDVAILKIEAKQLPVVVLDHEARLELGQTAIAIGNAMGLFRNTVSLGIISGLSRSITAQESPKAPMQELRGLIQTDAAINPGNSGGPLVDIKGNAIGINAAVVYGAQSIGFAIPINAARRDLEDIKTYGKIRRPMLGVRYFILDDALAAKIHAPVSYGALVLRESPHDPALIPGSPAEKAGLQEGDVILECNGEQISMGHTIQDALDNLSAGDPLTMLVWRKGKQWETKVILAERK